MDSALLLSARSATPMYAQIVQQIGAKIIAGEWAAGSALPSIRELASASNVSVITVKRAYLELEHAGLIVTRQGKGSFVADTLDRSRQLAIDEFNAQLANLLSAAKALGLSAQDIVRRVEDALSDQADDATALSTTSSRDSSP